MDWALGKWEMLRWILQKLDFWRSISGLHIVLKVQNRGQPIQNYWCRRPYCLSVKGLAIIDLPWSSFGKCFWDDKNWGWESFPLPLPSKDWYPIILQISFVTFSCLFDLLGRKIRLFWGQVMMPTSNKRVNKCRQSTKLEKHVSSQIVPPQKAWKNCIFFSSIPVYYTSLKLMVG